MGHQIFRTTRSPGLARRIGQNPLELPARPPTIPNTTASSSVVNICATPDGTFREIWAAIAGPRSRNSRDVLRSLFFRPLPATRCRVTWPRMQTSDREMSVVAFRCLSPEEALAYIAGDASAATSPVPGARPPAGAHRRLRRLPGCWRKQRERRTTLHQPAAPPSARWRSASASSTATRSAVHRLRRHGRGLRGARHRPP